MNYHFLLKHWFYHHFSIFSDFFWCFFMIHPSLTTIYDIFLILIVRHNFFWRWSLTISKPLEISSQTFGTKFFQRFLITQPLKPRFLKFFNDATIENKSFWRLFEGRNLCAQQWFIDNGLPMSSAYTELPIHTQCLHWVNTLSACT